MMSCGTQAPTKKPPEGGFHSTEKPPEGGF